MPRAVKPIDDILREPITVAVLGSGGREHALATKIAESPLCKKVIVLPGNDGMVYHASKISIKKEDVFDFNALGETLKKLKIDLVVVGPDDLLAAGVVDALTEMGLTVFGPTKAAARIEWSKTFGKEMMRLADVQTADFMPVTADDVKRLDAVAKELGGFPIVLKYDGLALGKGVRICADENDAVRFLKEVFEDKVFAKSASKSGPAAPHVVAERFLQGHEVSLFALTDGENYVALEPACDHKRLLDGNMGPNTGGMGAYSPVPWLTRDHFEDMAKVVFRPLLAQLKEAGTPFKGLLYAGLMVQGRDSWVIEFNARFGDPETQALLPRLESDLLPLLWGVATDSFERHLIVAPLRWSSRACVNIVAASRGYPQKPETGFEIEGLDAIGDARLFFSGVKSDNGRFLTSGGRVLSVSCLEESLAEAAAAAQAAIRKVRFEGMQFRKDVGRLASQY